MIELGTVHFEAPELLLLKAIFACSGSILIWLRIGDFIQVLILLLALFEATFGLESFSEKGVVDLLLELLVSSGSHRGIFGFEFIFIVTL
jgi:hypothetical protein